MSSCANSLMSVPVVFERSTLKVSGLNFVVTPDNEWNERIFSIFVDVVMSPSRDCIR